MPNELQPVARAERPEALLLGTRRALRAGARSALSCVPSMARNYVGESPTARFSQSRRLGKRQGRRREVGSEGS